MQKNTQTKPHSKPKPAGKKLSDEIDKIIKVTQGQNEALGKIIREKGVVKRRLIKKS